MKIKKFIYFIFLSGLFLVLPNYLRAGNLPVRLYTSADGLGSSFVNSMSRDSRGFMWFATRDGLSRFDGLEFTTYKIGKNADAPGIEQIYESETGVYWITTTGGTYRFDSNVSGDAKIINDSDEKILDAQFVTAGRSAVYKDKKGSVWMGGGLPILVTEANGAFSFEEIAVNYPSEEWRKHQIVDFFETTDESLWMVTAYGLIRRLADQRTAFYHFGENDTDDLKYALPDAEGRIWLTFNNSVEVFQPESAGESEAGENVIARNFPLAKTSDTAETFVLPKISGQISHFALAEAGMNFRKIYESSNRHIWIAARNSVIEFDGQKQRRYLAAQGIPAQVGLICEDAGGNMWFGGQGGAARLNRFGMESFSAADNLKSEEIQSLYERNGVFYAVNDGNISRFDGSKFETVRPNIDENSTFSWLSNVAFPDGFGDWWILTQNKLYRFAVSTEFADLGNQKPSAVYTTADGLKGSAVFCIFEDSRGDLWISTRGSDAQTNGLTHWSRADGKFYPFGEKDNFPAGKSPVSFAENSDGTLLFSFYEDGLIRYKNGVFTEIKENLPKGFFTQILFDRRNRLWLASAQSGVTRFDNPQDLTNVSARYTTENGLASNNARSIVEAANGDIYIGTARGVDRIANNSGEIRHYSIADGLSGDFVGSSLAEPGGALWFGTTNGLSRLVPKDENKTPAPPVWIGNLRVSGENRFVPPLGAKEISGLELAPNQNNLQIDFFAVNFAAGGDMRYQYKLENADANWSEPTAQRTINFANLVSGDYQFAVRAVSGDGVFSESPAAVSFTIAPPVYRRWWFLLSAGLLGAAAIFGLDRFRVKKTRQVETALEISRESAERFRTLAQTASDAIITVNKDSRIVFVNDAVESIFGYTEKELIGADLTMLMPEGLRGAHNAGMERYVETNKKHISWSAIELPGKHKTGRTIPLELSFGEFTSDGKRYFTGIARDVSERKKAGEVLRHAFSELSVSENRFRQMNEQSPLGTVIFAPDGSIRSVNRAYEQFWGITFEQIKHWDFLSDEQIIKSGVAEKLRPVFSGGTMALPPIPYDPQTNSAGVKVDEKAETRWIQSFAYPVKSDAGELLEVVLVMEDVTDTKRAAEIEQKAKTDRLRELEQVRRRIAADLHDDIGSSLTQISIFSEVLQQRVDKTNERVLEPLEFIAASSRELVEAMSDIVWAINPQKDFLGELSGKMRRFASDVFTARDIEFTFNAADLDDKLALGANLRREIFLIFKESVNNIVKHAKCAKVEIELSVTDSEIRLRLQNDGAGFDVDKITDGHGLVSMKQRAEGLGGTLEIVSGKTIGTTTLLLAPLTANADEKVL